MVKQLPNRGAWSHLIPRPICGNQNTIISAIVPEQISDTVTFIEAEGDGLTYQWLCRAPGASSFEYLTGSDATSSTLRVEMAAESNGAEYRCFINNSAGEMASTRIATVKLDSTTPAGINSNCIPHSPDSGTPFAGVPLFSGPGWPGGWWIRKVSSLLQWWG